MNTKQFREFTAALAELCRRFDVAVIGEDEGNVVLVSDEGAEVARFQIFDAVNAAYTGLS